MHSAQHRRNARPSTLSRSLWRNKCGRTETMFTLKQVKRVRKVFRSVAVVWFVCLSESDVQTPMIPIDLIRKSIEPEVNIINVSKQTWKRMEKQSQLLCAVAKIRWINTSYLDIFLVCIYDFDQLLLFDLAVIKRVKTWRAKEQRKASVNTVDNYAIC